MMRQQKSRPMKFTIDWLKDHLDTTASNDEIIETLTMVGLEVEEVEDQAKVLNDFVNFVSTHPEFEPDLLEVTAMVGNDKSPKTLLELAQYYLKIGDKEKALFYFEDILKEEPNNFSVLKDPLLLQLDLGLNEKAAERSEKTIELYPAQPIFYLVNGVANNKLKQQKKAIESLEVGLDYIIDDVKMEIDFYTQLSLAYQLDNNITKSQAFAKKAEALTKGNQP